MYGTMASTTSKPYDDTLYRYHDFVAKASRVRPGLGNVLWKLKILHFDTKSRVLHVPALSCHDVLAYLVL